MSQRNRPHNTLTKAEDDKGLDSPSDSEDLQDKQACSSGTEQSSLFSGEIVYHLILEGLDVSYRIDGNGNVIVEKISESSTISNSRRNGSNYLAFRDRLS